MRALTPRATPCIATVLQLLPPIMPQVHFLLSVAIMTAQPVRLARPSRPSKTDTQVQAVDFGSEYHYVIEDLKRIGITAVALLVLLIVLAMIIT